MEAKTNYYTLFHKGLGIVYLVALMPLFFQIKALIGENGLLPARNLIKISIEQQGHVMSFIQYPSLFHFFSSDFTLYCTISIGCIGALMLVLGFYTFYGALISWISFLSITTIGGDFFIIIIDLFLSEVGFLAIFSTYYIKTNKSIPFIVDFAFRLINFRLWFCMGVNKFYLPQNVWSDFTFFDFFFQAQPMPTPLAPYLALTPKYLKTLAIVLLFIGEIIVPIFVFCGKKLRYIAFGTFVIISTLIELSGNYGFFNLLSVVLAITILEPHNIKVPKLSLYNASAIKMILSAHIVIQFAYCIYIFNPKPYSYQNHFNYLFNNWKFENRIVTVLIEPFRWVGYWRIVNPYGVFKGIPHYHAELRFSGSIDGKNWKNYEFNYLPSGITQYLGFYAPYYPRLDHVMFYETLNEGAYKHNPLNKIYNETNTWSCTFITKLLLNDTDVTALLKMNPFANTSSPKLIRVRPYRLEFSRNTKQIWKETPFQIEKTYTLNNPCKLPILNYEEAMSVVFNKH